MQARTVRIAALRQTGEALTDGLKQLQVGAIWTSFWTQPWSFKLTCFYVFWEYVRPQQIYSWLLGPPWALTAIMCALLAFVLEGFAIRSRTIINGLMIAFSVVVLLSCLAADDPQLSFSKINTYINWVLAFLLIANTTATMQRWFMFLVLYILWNIKMSQFGFRAFLLGVSSGGAPGWFQNSGEFALEMCMFVPLSLQFLIGLYPKLSWWKVTLLALIPLSGVASVSSSGSRGGQLALACVGLWMLMVSRRKVRGLVLLAVAAPLTWMLVPAAQKARFDTAGTDDTSLARIAYWKAGVEMVQTHPILGIGYENWTQYYGQHYPASAGGIVRVDENGKLYVEVAHNSFIEIASQLGYSGLLLFAALLVSIWIVNLQTRRVMKRFGDRARLIRQMTYGLDAGVVGFVVAGFFMAVAFYPFVWFQLAMTASLHTVAQLEAARLRARDDDPAVIERPHPTRTPSWRSRGFVRQSGHVVRGRT